MPQIEQTIEPSDGPNRAQVGVYLAEDLRTVVLQVVCETEEMAEQVFAVVASARNNGALRLASFNIRTP